MANAPSECRLCRVNGATAGRPLLEKPSDGAHILRCGCRDTCRDQDAFRTVGSMVALNGTDCKYIVSVQRKGCTRPSRALAVLCNTCLGVGGACWLEM